VTSKEVAMQVVVLELIVLAAAWFLVSLFQASWKTYMGWRYGSDRVYVTDPWETKVWMFTLVVAANAVYLVLPGGM
jgi:sterol desaturase/sphingolipid hydroxylase (fatty acid hydroxylase superfamily)